jgi:predicted PhzF superfamily epimerase YddE/YHI9
MGLLVKGEKAVNIHVEVTRIESDGNAISSNDIYGRVDGDEEEFLHRYFARQDEMPFMGHGGIVGGVALAGLRHHQICETCFKHKGVGVMGYMMHGFEGYFCRCCLALQNLESAEERAAKIPELRQDLVEQMKVCGVQP